MNEVGFCPVLGGVLSSGVLSCGVLSVWGLSCGVLSVHQPPHAECGAYIHLYSSLLIRLA